MGLGPLSGTHPCQTANTEVNYRGSQNGGAKLVAQEENSPDRRLRSLMYTQWETMWERINNQDVGLEAAMHLKSA